MISSIISEKGRYTCTLSQIAIYLNYELLWLDRSVYEQEMYIAKAINSSTFLELNGRRRAWLIFLHFYLLGKYWWNPLNFTRKPNCQKTFLCVYISTSSLSIYFVLALNKNHFHFHYVIGRGGFGKVWKVENRKEKKLYAMKEMAKARIISKRSVNSVMNEKKFLC